MTPSSFLPLLESELHARAVPFSRADVQTFIADAWTLILDDPDPARWGEAFLEASKTTVDLQGELQWTRGT